jgi:hypothetical protein
MREVKTVDELSIRRLVIDTAHTEGTLSIYSKAESPGPEVAGGRRFAAEVSKLLFSSCAFHIILM